LPEAAPVARQIDPLDFVQVKRTKELARFMKKHPELV